MKNMPSGMSENRFEMNIYSKYKAKVFGYFWYWTFIIGALKFIVAECDEYAGLENISFLRHFWLTHVVL